MLCVNMFGQYIMIYNVYVMLQTDVEHVMMGVMICMVQIDQDVSGSQSFGHCRAKIEVLENPPSTHGFPGSKLHFLFPEGNNGG